MNEKEINRHIGARIRRARTDRGLSLRDLSERIKGKRGYSIMSLSSMERGVTTIQVSDLELLAEVLEYPVSYFMPETTLLKESTLMQDEEALIESLRRVPPHARAAILKAVFAIFQTHRD
jgi:transcriptional regulator with XRE-family HTH domain